MNREIKFRYWCKYENKMYDKAYVDEHLNLAFMSELLESAQERYVFQQYTGLKDKNQNPIYEGDIVEYSDYSGGVYLGKPQPKSRAVVKWQVDGTGYRLPGMGFSIKQNKCEVIGDIYTTPELLNGDSQ